MAIDVCLMLFHFILEALNRFFKFFALLVFGVEHFGEFLVGFVDVNEFLDVFVAGINLFGELALELLLGFFELSNLGFGVLMLTLALLQLFIGFL